MNPTQRGPVGVRKPGLNLPRSIPDTEEERGKEARELIAEVRNLGDEAWKRWTTWELEILGDLNDGRACTRVRLMEIRDAVERIKREFTKNAPNDRH